MINITFICLCFWPPGFSVIKLNFDISKGKNWMRTSLLQASRNACENVQSRIPYLLLRACIVCGTAPQNLPLDFKQLSQSLCSVQDGGHGWGGDLMSTSALNCLSIQFQSLPPKLLLTSETHLSWGVHIHWPTRRHTAQEEASQPFAKHSAESVRVAWSSPPQGWTSLHFSNNSMHFPPDRQPLHHWQFGKADG